jgi:hypothetical protein
MGSLRMRFYYSPGYTKRIVNNKTHFVSLAVLDNIKIQPLILDFNHLYGNNIDKLWQYERYFHQIQ